MGVGLHDSVFDMIELPDDLPGSIGSLLHLHCQISLRILKVPISGPKNFTVIHRRLHVPTSKFESEEDGIEKFIHYGIVHQ